MNIQIKTHIFALRECLLPTGTPHFPEPVETVYEADLPAADRVRALVFSGELGVWREFKTHVR